jgi:hypothetical protein
MKVSVTERGPNPAVSEVFVLRDEPRLKLVRLVCRVKTPSLIAIGPDRCVIQRRESLDATDFTAEVTVSLGELGTLVHGDPEWWNSDWFHSDKYDVMMLALPVTDYCGGDRVYEISESGDAQ